MQGMIHRHQHQHLHYLLHRHHRQLHPYLHLYLRHYFVIVPHHLVEGQLMLHLIEQQLHLHHLQLLTLVPLSLVVQSFHGLVVLILALIEQLATQLRLG